MISKSVFTLILNTCVKRRGFIRGKVSKFIKKLLISYPKCILSCAGDNQPGKSKERKRE